MAAEQPPSDGPNYPDLQPNQGVQAAPNPYMTSEDSTSKVEVAVGAPQPEAPPQTNSETAPVTGDKTYRDWPWAILFLVHLVAILLIAIITNAVNDSKATTGSNSTSTGTSLSSEESANTYPQMATAVFFGAFLAGCWIMVMRKFAGQLIKCCLISTLVLCLVWTIMGFAAQNWAIGIVGLFVFALMACYVRAVWDRIPFATAMLTQVTKVINESVPATLFVAYGMVVLMIIFVLIWATAVYGSVKDAESAWVAVFLVLSFYWTLQVCWNVCHVTTAGTFATWYYHLQTVEDAVTKAKTTVCTMGDNPVRDSFKRAVTTSFGSICLGSLLIAIIQTIRFFIHQAREQAQRNGNAALAFCMCCIECCFNCIENLARYFNKYAFVFVATDGDTFKEAAGKTLDLFEKGLIDALVNDDLINGVLTFGILISALVDGLVMGIWSWTASDNGAHGMWVGLLCAGIGFGMVSICMSVVESGVATLYVLYATNPAQLCNNYPDFFEQLSGRHRGLLESKHQQELPPQYCITPQYGNNPMSPPTKDAAGAPVYQEPGTNADATRQV